jgi:putative ABC transport system permease protein
MWASSILLALRAIRRNLLRSFLTVLGIVIGVAAVITMVTVGNGATQAVRDQISSLGSNLLQVRPGQRLGPGMGTAGAPPFKEADVEAISAQIGGLKAVAPRCARPSPWWPTARTGRPPSPAAPTPTSHRQLDAGRRPHLQRRGAAPARPSASSAPPCSANSSVPAATRWASSCGSSPSPARSSACWRQGQAAMGIDQDDTVIVPLRTAQRRVTGSTKVNTLLISMQEGADSARITARLTACCASAASWPKATDNNFNVLDTAQIAQTLSGTTALMTSLLGAVAAVSLLVGGIGIMNIMLVSVTERTREIGVRLAIGALAREVLLQFLIEAVVLSSLGGLVGIVLATGASLGITALMGVPYLFNPGVNLLAFAFSAAIGVIFGYFPARRAAQLDPIEALRHE